MYYTHHQSSQPAPSSSKHHDGPVPGGPPNGLGAWGRHPFAPPGGPGGGVPLPSPGTFGAPGGPGGNGMMGYAPPPHHHSAHAPHHPSFGNGGGMHLGGNGGGMGMGYGMGMYGSGALGGAGGGGGSPPRQAEIVVPMTPFWQHQIMRADASRASNAPHHHARTVAIASRTGKSAAVAIHDPNQRPSSTNPGLNPATNAVPNGVHRKNTSLNVTSLERIETPPPPERAATPALSTVDPVDPLAAPAPTNKEEPTDDKPWSGIDMGGIKLRNLSPGLFAYTHIGSLYINHNVLTSLPPAISSLRQLTLLDATGNELTSIPPELGLLCKLKELLLFDNHLTTLPPEIGTLYQLDTLGIEGNPMEDRLKKLLAEEGTTALVSHLRDTCPIGPVPPERQWIQIEPDLESPSTGKQEAFTVLSYNILCHSFAPGTAYSYTPSWALDWNYRKQTILQEIVNASADIICLQEVDCEQYAEFFYPSLKEQGYDGSHYPRTRARTMAPDDAKVVDGCCTFWKQDRFSLIETQVVEFNQVALKRIDMRTDDMFNRVMARDNIAVIAALEFIASGTRLLVANSHIYWDHRYRDVKLVQIGMLMEELEKIVERFSFLPAKLTADPEFNNGRGPPEYDRAEKGRDIPLILCCDLNSLSDSAVYHFITTGDIPPDHEDFMNHVYGSYTKEGLQHGLGLRSTCSSFGELKMTNFTPTFEAAIDYIFHTTRNMKVTSVLGDVDRNWLERCVGFPNAHFPSDHIPVFAMFRIKGKADPAPVREVQHGYSR